MANTNEMTEQAAVTVLAMFRSMFLSAIVILTLGPESFHGGAMALLLIAVLIGTPDREPRNEGFLLRFGTLLPRLAVGLPLFYLCLRESTGGGVRFAAVLACAGVVYLSMRFAFLGILRWSPSFRRFACVKPQSRDKQLSD